MSVIEMVSFIQTNLDNLYGSNVYTVQISTSDGCISIYPNLFNKRMLRSAINASFTIPFTELLNIAQDQLMDMYVNPLIQRLHRIMYDTACVKVFAINGISLSGKDSFCERVRRHISDAFTLSTIDPIKEVYTNFFKWNGVKTDKDRKNLNTLKLMWIDVADGPTNWLRDQLHAVKQLSTMQSNSPCFVFVMVREFDELMNVLSLGDTLS